MNKSFDCFDFEQAILAAWTGNDDIGSVLEYLDEGASLDKIRNLLIGIKALQDMKFQKMFAMFEAGVAEEKIV